MPSAELALTFDSPEVADAVRELRWLSPETLQNSFIMCSEVYKLVCLSF